MSDRQVADGGISIRLANIGITLDLSAYGNDIANQKALFSFFALITLLQQFIKTNADFQMRRVVKHIMTGFDKFYFV